MRPRIRRRWRCGGTLFVDGTSNDGKPIYAKHIPEHIRLLPVIGRGPVTYFPPKEHLGRPLTLEEQSPYSVASLAAKYLFALVDEASKRT